MDVVQSVGTIGLGLIISWTVLSFTQVKSKTSYFTLSPWPLEESNSNLALIGVGLASPKPAPSVMDATPAPAQPMIMEPAAPVSGNMTHLETTSPMPITTPSPITLTPSTLMPPQLTPAPMSSKDMMPSPAPMADKDMVAPTPATTVMSPSPSV